MKKKAFTFFALLGSVVFAFATYACGDDDAVSPPDAGRTDTGTGTDAPSGQDSASDSSNEASKKVEAKATIAATGLPDAGSVTGSVDLVEENGTVAITISIAGATPGSHGMHIHTNGSCDANDAGPAGAAGGHWNPNDAGHGFPNAATHHPGDFGNIEIAQGGTGTLSLTSKDFTIQGTGTTSALNHAVIFHQGADDGTTQPTGNSGGRAGCGVIQPK